MGSEQMGVSVDDVCPVIEAVVTAIRAEGIVPGDCKSRLEAMLAPGAGTRSTPDVEVRRLYKCADAAVRVFTPMVLDAWGDAEWAAHLRGLPPIVDKDTAFNAGDTCSYAIGCLDFNATTSWAAAAAEYAARFGLEAAASARRFDAEAAAGDRIYTMLLVVHALAACIRDAVLRSPADAWDAVETLLTELCAMGLEVSDGV